MHYVWQQDVSLFPYTNTGHLVKVASTQLSSIIFPFVIGKFFV